MRSALVFAFLLAALLPALAAAENPQMYKWTDADGVLHYSDQPPKQPAADLQTLDIPQFPAVDPAQLAARQAEQSAELKSLRELLAVQDLEQERAALARQSAALQAELTALQQSQAEPEPVQVVYSVSRFRDNRFRFHHPVHNPHPSVPQPPPLAKLNPRGP